MSGLIARRPILAALVTCFGLLVITQGVVAAATDVRERTWPPFVLLGFVVYAASAIWFLARKDPALSRPLFEVLLALSAAPTIIGTGLAFQGAPEWSLWATVSASAALLLLSVLVTRTSAPRV